MEPALDEAPLSQHVLNLVASGLCDSRDGLREFLLSSFTGEKKWKGQAGEFDRRLDNAVGICIHGDLMDESAGGVLKATDLGRAAAVKGVTVDTAIKLASFAKRHKDAETPVHLLDVLAVLNRTEDGMDVYFNLSTKEHESGMYLNLLRDGKHHRGGRNGAGVGHNCAVRLATGCVMLSFRQF
ncbi:MAG: hypothetical protein JW909_08600 [Planctomycetes bacterium]|nr:hypothetical protein [Planctomycetota bacterium]